MGEWLRNKLRAVQAKDEGFTGEAVPLSLPKSDRFHAFSKPRFGVQKTEILFLS